MAIKDPTIIVKDENRVPHRLQRARRGVSEWDAINADDYLCFVIVNVLERMKESMGYPAALTEKEWAAYLDIMIDGFTAWLNRWDEDAESFQTAYAKLQSALALFQHFFTDLWD